MSAIRHSQAVIVDPHSHTPQLAEPARAGLEEEWNDTESPYPLACVHHLFEAQAYRTPNRVALTFENRQLTYEELNSRSNRVAHFLRGRGVCRGTLVGICIDRSIDMVVGMLAILKSGGVYVPLDPTWPTERLALIADNSRMRIAITETGRLDVAPDVISLRLCIDAEAEAIAHESSDDPADLSEPHDIAYVLHTSGSTGLPKGVQIAHRAIVNFLCSMARRPGIASADVLVAVTTISFDIACLELFLPLICGAQVVVASFEETRDPLKLAALLERHSATVMQATPSTWRMLESSGWAGRPNFKALCGGEALSRTLASALIVRCSSLWNLYGPTETTVWSTIQEISDTVSRITIGSPIANTQVYLLDQDFRSVPIGNSAELYIGGDGLACGYFDLPDLTAERFIPNPFSRAPGTRLYRTGDFARRLLNGEIELLGRADNQVKIRGFRIELSEIENRLREHANVQDAVVAAREDLPGDRRLVGYIIGQRGSRIGAQDLRAHVQATLPDYMTPQAFVFLDRFPVTPNGKLDRKALPPPDTARYGLSTRLVEPSNKIEATLQGLWEEALDIRPIGVDDRFLELGGNSIIAAAIFSRMREVFNREIPISNLIQAPTIAEIAEILRRIDTDQPASSLVAIKPSGTKTPFFCVHGAGANILHLTRLADHLEPNQPFYALQSQGLDGKCEPFTATEAMAGHYIAEVQAVQPHGPYLLGGLSFGGAIAFEMAQQLHLKGETTALLVLWDTNYTQRPKVLPHHHPWFQDRVYTFVERMERRAIERKQVGTLTLLTTEVPQIWRNLVRRLLKRARIRVSETAPEISATLRKVWEANLIAAAAYKPQYYVGKVTLLWATDWKVTELLQQPDLRMKWSEVAGGGLEVHTIPGNPVTMRREPYVGEMVKKLNVCLARANDEISALEP